VIVHVLLSQSDLIHSLLAVPGDIAEHPWRVDDHAAYRLLTRAVVVHQEHAERTSPIARRSLKFRRIFLAHGTQRQQAGRGLVILALDVEAQIETESKN